MGYLHLIWAGMFRRRVRTILMLLSITVAFLLYGPLETVRSTFANFGQSIAGHDRLLTLSKLRPGAPVLPQSLLERIKEVPGITNVDYAVYFGGTYQDAKNNVPLESHTETFFDLYPELALTAGERTAFQQTRTGAIVGAGLAKKFNWRIGDKIPFQTTVTRKDGSNVWTFDVVGIYRFTDPGMQVWDNTVYINWHGFDEARLTASGNVGWYVLKVANTNQVDNVAHAVDALSANSAHETKTQSENSFSAGWIGQIGDFGLIVTSIMSAVFFTLLLLTGHTIAQAVQERIPEFAVLKTLGFSGGTVLGLVLSESVLLLLLGSTLGLALATLALSFASSLPDGALPVPLQPVSVDVWLRGLAVAILIGLIVGAVPALRGLRLRIVDALAEK
ncbi:ABC transporter permease [Steroidobacter sp.]|uniref:ABC transporter permease n=1 Tax=Steroidobacter sp. TaxID=1978227 RepID=UPI001A605838|nr:ABC transporter permease [Steroidobacter sp.]MBL8271078.1 ABC transporter permease [Steroidobacter sp.]